MIHPYNVEQDSLQDPSPLSWQRILVFIAGVVYLLSPLDLVPDFIPLLGWVDDVVVVYLLVQYYLLPGMQGKSLFRASSGPKFNSPMHSLLSAAASQGGVISKARAVALTGFSPEEIQLLLQDAIQQGLAEIGNDPETGAIRYYFDL